MSLWPRMASADHWPRCSTFGIRRDSVKFRARFDVPLTLGGKRSALLGVVPTGVSLRARRCLAFGHGF
jgi:hypothetical protein